MGLCRGEVLQADIDGLAWWGIFSACMHACVCACVCVCLFVCVCVCVCEGRVIVCARLVLHCEGLALTHLDR